MIVNKSNSSSQKFDKISVSDKQLNKNSSNYSRASNTTKKYYSTINSNSERGHEVTTKMLRKDIEERKMKYNKNRKNKGGKLLKGKSNANVTSTYKPDRHLKKSGKYPEKPARIKAALICKYNVIKILVSNEKSGKQSKVVQLNTSKNTGDNDSAEHSTIGIGLNLT